MTDAQDTFDFVIIGAGAAGEAALELARERGRSVAIVDRDLFGGSCAYWACMPSKSLLHAAAVHHAGGDYPWSKASDFRDWMINREDIDYPSDAGHEQRYRDVGAEPIRGTARLDGPGTVRVALADGGERVLHGEDIVIAVGSHSRIPDIVGLDSIDYWDNREGTGTRELPRSLVIMGGGPTGTELAQAYARFGVPVTLIDSNPRILARDHPRNSALIREALERDGVSVRTGVRAVRVDARAGADGAHRVGLSDGSSVEGHEVMVSIGRAVPYEDLGLETVGITPDGRMPRPDDQLRLAPHLYLVGDAAGPELHTHLGHYQGEMAVRIALGEESGPTTAPSPGPSTPSRRQPRSVCCWSRPWSRATRPSRPRADLAETAKGVTSESEGHITIVVDRGSRTLLGAFIGGPGASELIHEAVLAVKLRVPLAQLADTIHAFPTVGRVMGNLFVQVYRELEGVAKPDLTKQR